jgi:hypothetical protein
MGIIKSYRVFVSRPCNWKSHTVEKRISTCKDTSGKNAQLFETGLTM